MDTYTIQQAADHMDVDPATVRRAIKRGKLEARKVDGKWSISQDTLLAYMNARGKKARKSTTATHEQSTLHDYTLVRELYERIRTLESERDFLRQQLERVTVPALPMPKARDTRPLGVRIREWFAGAQEKEPGKSAK